jgi:hypothetical protein
MAFAARLARLMARFETIKLAAPNVAGEVINIACGTRISLNELVRVINGLVGTNLQPVYKPERPG